MRAGGCLAKLSSGALVAQAWYPMFNSWWLLAFHLQTQKLGGGLLQHANGMSNNVNGKNLWGEVGGFYGDILSYKPCSSW